MKGRVDKPERAYELTFEIRHGEPVAVDPRRVDVRVKGPEGRRAHIVETLQQQGQRSRQLALSCTLRDGDR